MPETIPFNDLKLSSKGLQSALSGAFQKTLNRGAYILGSETAHFEKDFARYIGAPYCVGVASGTDAITLSLKALGIGEGDEVITSALTAYPTITGISQSGARPVVVDVCPEDGLLNPKLVKKALSRKTKAIVPVHLYGQSCDMEPLLQLSRQRGVKIVEDCAQSAGALYQGRKTGSWGDCAAYSFYPTKNLGAIGDAGAVLTRHFSVYQKLLRLRDYGRTKENLFSEKGMNSRLDELQAALLRVKLPRLEGWVQQRRNLANEYRKCLPDVVFLKEHKGRRHAYHLLVVKVPNRKRVMKFLAARGIQSRVHYARPVQNEKAFTWPVSEKCVQASQLCREVLSLPFYPGMTDSQVHYVSRCLREALNR